MASAKKPAKAPRNVTKPETRDKLRAAAARRKAEKAAAAQAELDRIAAAADADIQRKSAAAAKRAAARAKAREKAQATDVVVIEPTKPDEPAKVVPDDADQLRRAVFDDICLRLACGEDSLRAILRKPDMPALSTFFRWIHADTTSQLWEQYTRARAMQMECWAEDLIEIADDSRHDWVQTENGPRVDSEAIQRSKLRVDARKWVMGKMANGRFGEKLELAGKVESGKTMLTDEQALAMATEVAAQIADKRKGEGDEPA